MPIFKVLLTLLSILLIGLLSYILFKNTNNQKEKTQTIIHIAQMNLPASNKDENDDIILSHLKEYIDETRRHNKNKETTDEKILKELKIYTSKNIPQNSTIIERENEKIKIKKELEVLTTKLTKKIDKEVKSLKKEIDKNSIKITKNSKKIDKKIAKVNKKLTNISKKSTIKHQSSINQVVSQAYVLDEGEKKLTYGEIETIAASHPYRIEEEGPIKNPIDISTKNEENLDDLNFVQTLGVVEVSEPYLSNDEVM